LNHDYTEEDEKDEFKDREGDACLMASIAARSSIVFPELTFDDIDILYLPTLNNFKFNLDMSFNISP
jgi:hypothetical protein